MSRENKKKNPRAKTEKNRPNVNNGKKIKLYFLKQSTGTLRSQKHWSGSSKRLRRNVRSSFCTVTAPLLYRRIEYTRLAMPPLLTSYYKTFDLTRDCMTSAKPRKPWRHQNAINELQSFTLQKLSRGCDRNKYISLAPSAFLRFSPRSFLGPDHLCDAQRKLLNSGPESGRDISAYLRQQCRNVRGETSVSIRPVTCPELFRTILVTS